MKKALFLDRDGVLNREVGDYTFRVDDFEILPDVIPALKLAKEKGYLLIVISNQGGIARKIFTHDDVRSVHGKLLQTLEDTGIELQEIFYCPHHDMVGKCLCRKPDSLMLEKAIARFNIDRTNSVFIGDSQRDVDAALKVGVKGFLINSNQGFLKIVEDL
ncbi:MAG: HAD family hydrolase [Flavobacteriales bacterium]|nr:HAD family hydrolase [Flavobacteriales bacterium]